MHLLWLLLPAALVCVPFWPGHIGGEMLADIDGMRTGRDGGAPLLLELWERFYNRGAGPGFVLLTQVAAFVSGGYLVLRSAFGRPGALAGVTLLTVFPPLYGQLGTVSADTWGLALIVLAAGCGVRSVATSGRGRGVWLVLGAAAVVLALDARPHDVLTAAVVACAPALALPGPRRRRMAGVAAALAVVLLGIGLHALAGPGGDRVGADQYRQALDIGRVSAITNENLMPREVADTDLGQVVLWVSPESSRGFFDDRLGPRGAAPLTGAQREALAEGWRDVVREEPVAWLESRFDVLGRSVGVTSRGRQVFQPRIEANALGFAPRFPSLDDAATGYVEAFVADDALMWGGVLHEPWLYLLLAVAGGAVLVRRRSPELVAAGIAGFSAAAHQLDLLLWAPEVLFTQQVVVLPAGLLVAAVALRRLPRPLAAPRPAPVLVGLGAVLCGWSLVGDTSPPAALLRLLGLALLVAALFGTGRGWLRLLPRSLPRADVLALAVLTIAAAVVRGVLLGGDPRYDESFTYIWYATLPLGEAPLTYPVPNNHIFHNILMHGVWEILGERLMTVRLVAFLAGVACVPAAYFAGRALFDRTAGLVSAAIAAASIGLIDFSVNGRGYTLVFLGFLLLITLSARLVERRDRRRWALWIVVAVLSLYSVPTAAIGIAGISAWMGLELLVRREPRRLLELVAAGTAALAATGLLYFETLDDAGWGYGESFSTPLDKLFQHVIAYPHWELTVWTYLLLGLAAASLALHRGISRFRVPIAVVGVAVMPLFYVAMNPPSPFTRSWFHVALLLILAAGAGASALAGRLRVPERFAPAAAMALGVITCASAVNIGLVIGEDPPIDGAEKTVAWLRTQPQTQIVSPGIASQAFIVEARFQGVPLRQIALGYTPPPAGRPPRMLAVSRGSGETLEDSLSKLKLPPGTTPRRVRTIERVDLYTLTR